MTGNPYDLGDVSSRLLRTQGHLDRNEIESLHAEIARLRRKYNRLHEAVLHLALNLSDVELDLAGEVWGWTNVAVVKNARERVLELLKGE